MTVGIVGLGLIGGSLAKAYKKADRRPPGAYPAGYGWQPAAQTARGTYSYPAKYRWAHPAVKL